MTWGVVLLLVGCGDPRTPFVGGYGGTRTETVTYSNGAKEENSGPYTFYVTAPKGTDRLQFDDDCGLTADVAGEGEFQFDPIACMPFRGRTNGGSMATFQETWSAGNGTLTNNTLVMTLVGERIGSNYSDAPGTSARFQLRVNITATK